MTDSEQSYNEWFKSNWKWLVPYLLVAWSGHIGLGMALAVFGPTQPYLGKQTGVEVDTVNVIWTARSLGVIVTSIITAFVFRSYCNTTFRKLIFLALSEAITGAFMIATPYANHFSELLFYVTIYGFGLGMFDTSDNSLIVYIFGPQKSRPFTQSLHTMVGVGFLMATPICKPFLPESETSHVCPKMPDETDSIVQESGNVTELVNWTPDEFLGMSKIAWPYLLMGIWHFGTTIGFLALAFSGKEMPRFHHYGMASDGDKNVDNFPTEEKFTEVKFWLPVLVMVYFYYCLTCGLEGFFQAMTYTYGICGPLKLSVNKAAWLTGTYYACFMTGRFSGIFVSRYVSPKKLIFTSLLTCIGAAIVLCIFAGIESITQNEKMSEIGLFIGTGLMGFGIATQFPSGVSWTAKRFDVTGKASFIFFTGGYTGFLSFPPLAGMIFTSSVGAVGIFYLTLGFTSALFLHFIFMNICAGIKK